MGKHSEFNANQALSDTAKLRLLDLAHGEIERAMLRQSAERAERAERYADEDLPSTLKVQAT